MKRTNRPFKFGDRQQQISIVRDSETAKRMVNDTNGNPVFVGTARAGSAESEAVWQLQLVVYDANQSPVKNLWAVPTNDAYPSDYIHVWAASDPVDITAISQANPAEVTTDGAHGFTDGDKVIIQFVNGMTEVNFDSTDDIFTVANSTANTFELSGVNSSGYTLYSSGGQVTNGNFCNVSYA